MPIKTIKEKQIRKQTCETGSQKSFIVPLLLK